LLTNVTFFFSVESLDIQNMEQEYIKKEKERIEIASNGIDTVLKSCIKRLSMFHNILVNAKPKVNLIFLNNKHY
jgi:hypothetical protein